MPVAALLALLLDAHKAQAARVYDEVTPIDSPSCTEDLVQCLKFFLPAKFRWCAFVLQKKVSDTLYGDRTNLAKWYLDRSIHNNYEIAYRGNTIVALNRPSAAKALHDLTNRLDTNAPGEFQVRGWSLFGPIVRGNALGNLELNSVGQFYDRFHGIGLGSPSPIHDRLRPHVEKLYGTKVGEFEQQVSYTGFNGKGDGNHWSDAALLRSAKEFLDSQTKLSGKKPFCYWAIQQFHAVLGIDDEILAESETSITDPAEYARKLCEYQDKIVMISVVPNNFVAWSLGKTWASQAFAWRRQAMKDYVKAVRKKLGLTEPQLISDIAAAIMDAHLFAGGLSVPNLIMSCVAMLYRHGKVYNFASGGAGTLGQGLDLTDFVWEVIRTMPPVHFVPMWYSTQKVLVCTACAGYDASVWEPQTGKKLSLEFKIYSRAAYEKHSIQWADEAHNKQSPSQDRWCPGKRLSISMIVAFLQAFLEVRDTWQLEEGHVWKDQHLSPYVNEFNLIRGGS